MGLLQNTWLEIQALDLAYRSTPYTDCLVFADDFRVTEEDAMKLSIPVELNVVARRLAKKLTNLEVTKEEYVLLKAMVLLNPGMLIVFCCKLKLSSYISVKHAQDV